MSQPILDLIVAAIDAPTEAVRLETAQRVLARLRDFDLDPDVLTARLDACDAQRNRLHRRVDAYEARHATMTAELAEARDTAVLAQVERDAHAGSTRLLADALAGNPFDLDAARHQVEALTEPADAET